MATKKTLKVKTTIKPNPIKKGGSSTKRWPSRQRTPEERRETAVANLNKRIPKGVLVPEEVKVKRLARRMEVVLNPKQAAFVEYYLIDCNAKQAYIRAYGANPQASSHATHLLKIPKVRAAIDAKQKTLADRLGITQEAVLREMKAIAFSNIEDYIRIDSEGQAVVDLQAMDRAQAGALQEVTSKRYYDKDAGAMVTETKLKPYNKKDALEILGRYVGIKGFGVKGVEITTPDGPLQVEHLMTLTDEQLAKIAAGQGPKQIEGTLNG